MLKKLDILILRSFIGNFIAAFAFSLFILVMQFFWLYIDDMVGKGMDMPTIFRLVSYVAATVFPLALPLALLFSSILTFGGLGETFELVAIKTAGISLLRFMRPLFFVSLLLGGIAFVFANNIIPIVQLKLERLKYDMIVSKPTFDIREGVFYDKFDGYIIKFSKKDEDNKTIHNVVIYERNYNVQDIVIVAESGIMQATPDNLGIEFTLKNGWRYEERGARDGTSNDFFRMGFKEYHKMFDLRGFKSETPEASFRNNASMLTANQLKVTIDSLDKQRQRATANYNHGMDNYFVFSKYLDTIQNTTPSATKLPASFSTQIPDSLRSIVYEQSKNLAGRVAAYVDSHTIEEDTNKKHNNSFLLEWHRKFTLSVACIVLFLIGAPLGSIIRKGGLGMPLLFSIVFFMIFHICNVFGEKFAKEEVLPVGIGMWLSTIILTPIGIFLTYAATKDSQIFDSEVYYKFFKTTKILTVVNFIKTRAKYFSIKPYQK